MDQASRPDSPPVAGKKAYATPHLIEYGSVAKLTQFFGTRGADSRGRRRGGRRPGG